MQEPEQVGTDPEAPGRDTGRSMGNKKAKTILKLDNVAKKLDDDLKKVTKNIASSHMLRLEAIMIATMRRIFKEDLT